MANKRIAINVTRQCIRNGSAGDSMSCPIALALRRVGFLGSIVHFDSFFIPLNCEEYNLSLKARKFIKDFDSDKKVKPFKFTIIVKKDAGLG